MMKIIIEMWPQGDESRKYLLGEAVIANVGGTEDLGNYEARLFKSPRYAKPQNVGAVWHKGIVNQFPRKRLGPWDLLYRALAVTVGYRNRG